MDISNHKNKICEPFHSRGQQIANKQKKFTPFNQPQTTLDSKKLHNIEREQASFSQWCMNGYDTSGKERGLSCALDYHLNWYIRKINE